jgi:hypothetical protein
MRIVFFIIVLVETCYPVCQKVSKFRNAAKFSMENWKPPSRVQTSVVWSLLPHYSIKAINNALVISKLERDRAMISSEYNNSPDARNSPLLLSSSGRDISSSDDFSLPQTPNSPIKISIDTNTRQILPRSPTNILQINNMSSPFLSAAASPSALSPLQVPHRLSPLVSPNRRGSTSTVFHKLKSPEEPFANRNKPGHMRSPSSKTSPFSARRPSTTSPQAGKSKTSAEIQAAALAFDRAELKSRAGIDISDSEIFSWTAALETGKSKVFLSENIAVCVRPRPENNEQQSSAVWTIGSNFIHEKDSSVAQPFYFEHVCKPESSTVEVYEHAALPIVASFLDGYNGTVFAYGQTGSG